MSSPSIALGMNNGIDFEIEWDDKGVSTLVQEVGLAFEEIKKVTVVLSNQSKTGHLRNSHLQPLKVFALHADIPKHLWERCSCKYQAFYL